MLPHATDPSLCIGSSINAFELVYSSEGICVGFNSPTTKDMYKSSEWLSHYNNIFMRDWQPSQPLKIPGSGDKFLLELTINNQLVTFDFPFAEVDSTKIYLTPNQYNAAHNTFWTKIRGRPGTLNELIISPILGIGFSRPSLPKECFAFACTILQLMQLMN